MNTYRINSETLDATFNKRTLRVALSVAAFSAVLAGYETNPMGIFLLCGASIYFMITATIGEGLLEVLVRSAGTVAKWTASTASHASNLGHSQRIARGATAGVALGGVLSGAFLIDAADIFALNVVGFFLAMTATVAWCPIIAALQYLHGRRRAIVGPQAPSTVAVSPIAARIARLELPTAAQEEVKEAA